MPVEKRRQRPAILGRQSFPQSLALDRFFHQESVHQHQAVLQQLQRKRDNLLLLAAVGRQFTLPAVAEKIVRIPLKWGNLVGCPVASCQSISAMVVW